MDRRFFVLAASGESGPFTPDDLKRELQAGRIQRGDQLRTALGKTVGTVGEMIGGGAPSRPSTRLSAVNVGGQGRAQSSERQGSSDHLRASAPPSSPRGGRRPETAARLPFIIIGALVLLLTIAWALSGSRTPPSPPVAAVEVVPPQVRIDVVNGLALPGRPGLVRITADRAPAADLALHGTISSPSAQRLVLPAGATTLDIPIPVPAKRAAPASGPAVQAPTEVSVVLQPGEGYRLGSSIHAKVAIRAGPDPTIAWEDFATHQVGWLDVWQGTQAREPIPGSGVRLTGDIAVRILAARVASGDVWLSFRMGADEDLADVSGLSTYDQGSELLFIGRATGRPGLTIEYTPQNGLFLTVPEHRFTTPSRIVVRLRPGAGDCKVSWWIDPAADKEQPEPLGTMAVPPMGIDAVRTLSKQRWNIGDLRIGRSWDEVVPLP